MIRVSKARHLHTVAPWFRSIGWNHLLGISIECRPIIVRHGRMIHLGRMKHHLGLRMLLQISKQMQNSCKVSLSWSHTEGCQHGDLSVDVHLSQLTHPVKHSNLLLVVTCILWVEERVTSNSGFHPLGNLQEVLVLRDRHPELSFSLLWSQVSTFLTASFM
jgi:hypothetical protein